MSRLARRLLSEVVACCDASEGTLWVPSQDRAHLEGALNQGRTAAIVESASAPVDDSVVGMVFCTGMAACIGPGDPHHPCIDEMTGTPTLAMAAAPVCIGPEIVGVLSAINPTAGGCFGQAQLEALQWKAYLMGLLLADARHVH